MTDWIAEPALAFWLVFRDGAPHEFCGAHSIPGAVCPHCAKPLLKLLALDATDPRLELRGAVVGRLPLLYCWSCQPEGRPFFYRVEPSGGVTILSRNDKAEGPPRPGAYPPEHADLKPVPLDDQRYLRLWQEGNMTWEIPEDLLEPRHQVGGVPFLAQSLDALGCPRCEQPMPFLATLAGDVEDGIQVVFHYCRRCGVVGAYHFAV
jgi:hypothetical protein